MQARTVFLLIGIAAALSAPGHAYAQTFGGRSPGGYVAAGPMGGFSAGQNRRPGNYGPFGGTADRPQIGATANPGGSNMRYSRGADARFGTMANRNNAVGNLGPRVEGPGVQTYRRVEREGVVRAGGVAVGGSSRSTIAGPFGSAGFRRPGGIYIR